jgi:hypothetical protein
VVLLRRRIKDEPERARVAEIPDQLRLSPPSVAGDGEVYEHAALVTSLAEPILGLGQLYRDRADCENVSSDELKNQWGHVGDMLPAWGGYTTRDLARCRLAARLVALVYNWWNLFHPAGRARRAPGGGHQPATAPDRHRRAHPPRPPDHAPDRLDPRQGGLGDPLAGIAAFLGGLSNAAEQLTPTQRRYRILSLAALPGRARAQAAGAPGTGRSLMHLRVENQSRRERKSLPNCRF